MIGAKKSKTQSYISNTLRKEEIFFIFALILMSKFNYKSSIITISCFKYLLTLFMDDIGVIGSYLSYPWLIRLVLYTINLTVYVT